MANFHFDLFVMGLSIFWIALSLGYLYFYQPAMAAAAEHRAAVGAVVAANGERRQAPRFVSRGDVILAWQTDNDAAASTRGPLLNLSEGGLAIRSPYDIAVGTYVYLEIPHLQSATTANVRHCKLQGRNWVVGVEFRGPLYPK